MINSASVEQCAQTVFADCVPTCDSKQTLHRRPVIMEEARESCTGKCFENVIGNVMHSMRWADTGHSSETQSKESVIVRRI